MKDAGLLPAKAVAEHLCVTENTLAKWRLDGSGPAFIRVNRRIAYDPADILAWIDDRRFCSTSEAA